MESIDKYNEQVGALYLTNPDLLMFSPAFSRCEGQTQLFLHRAHGRTVQHRSLPGSLLRFAAKVVRDLMYALVEPSLDLNTLPSRGVFVFSYFDKRNDRKGTLREEYFRNILEHEPEVACFYKLCKPGNPLRGLSYLRLLSGLKKTFQAYSEFSVISLGMVFRAVGKTLGHYFRFKRWLARQEKTPLLQALAQYHFREIQDGTVYFGQLQKLFFEKLLQARPRLILFVWENQCWERILETVKKQVSPETETRGFQHTGFSKNLLQHYPSPSERDLPSYPDRILCNGWVNRDELVQHSCLSSKVEVGGALRQDGILAQGVAPLGDLTPQSLRRIAFAFSWDFLGYDRILKDLEQVPEAVQIILKFHPDCPEWLEKADLPARFVNSRKSWQEVAAECNLVLASDNSLMFEGYFHGMHTAVYDGADPWGLGKRDFDSTIPHLNREDLPRLLDQEVIDRINAGTRQVMESGYLDRYFVQGPLSEMKQTFLGSGPT